MPGNITIVGEILDTRDTSERFTISCVNGNYTISSRTDNGIDAADVHFCASRPRETQLCRDFDRFSEKILR